MKPSDWAWITLGAGVVSFDYLCGDGDTMSEAADRYMLRHPWLVRGVAFGLAAHCCNLVPAQYDALHLAFVGMRKLRHL